jgi:hypothetical protein
MKRTQAKRFNETSSKDLANFVGEDSLDFEVLHTRLAEQWVPDGPDEEHAVYTMAKWLFLKRFLPTKKRTQEQRRKELGEFDRFSHQLRNGVSANEIEGVFNRCYRGKFLLGRVPRNKFDSEAAWIRALEDEIDATLGWQIALVEDLAEVRGEEPQPEAPAEKLSGDTLARELASEKLLDKAYDRALDRLLKIKAEKRKISFREVQRFRRSHPIG